MSPFSQSCNVAMIPGCPYPGPQKSTYPAQQLSQQLSQIQQGLNVAVLREGAAQNIAVLSPYLSKHKAHTITHGFPGVQQTSSPLLGALLKPPSIKAQKSNSLCIKIPGGDED